MRYPSPDSTFPLWQTQLTVPAGSTGSPRQSSAPVDQSAAAGTSTSCYIGDPSGFTPLSDHERAIIELQLRVYGQSDSTLPGLDLLDPATSAEYETLSEWHTGPWRATQGELNDDVAQHHPTADASVPCSNFTPVVYPVVDNVATAAAASSSTVHSFTPSTTDAAPPTGFTEPDPYAQQSFGQAGEQMLDLAWAVPAAAADPFGVYSEIEQ